MPLGQNINVTSDSTVSDGTYVGFIVLTFVGGLLAWFLVDAKSVVRDDGSRVIVMKHPTAASELLGVWQTLVNDPWIVLLWPMFFASNWFYTYQFNDVNLAQFNTRTRALNNVLYWSAQIVGAIIFGTFLDTKHLRRTTRAKAGWAALFVLTMVIWVRHYSSHDVEALLLTLFDRVVAMISRRVTLASKWLIRLIKRWTGPRPATLAQCSSTSSTVSMMLLGKRQSIGMLDVPFRRAELTCIRFMGAMSNNSRVLANYAAFYKGIQSAG